MEAQVWFEAGEHWCNPRRTLVDEILERVWAAMKQVGAMTEEQWDDHWKDMFEKDSESLGENEDEEIDGPDEEAEQIGEWEQRVRRRTWTRSKGKTGELAEIPYDCVCKAGGLVEDGKVRRWNRAKRGELGGMDELVQEMLMRGVDMRGRILHAEPDGNCFYHAVMAEILARYSEVLEPGHREWAAELFHHRLPSKNREIAKMLRWWTWVTQKRWFTNGWQRQYDEHETAKQCKALEVGPARKDKGAWMIVQSEEVIEEDWWIPNVHTNPVIVAPLLSLALGLNISILELRGGESGPEILAHQYGLKGAVYKKWFRERVGETGDETLGILMSREEELIRAVDQEGLRPELVEEVVYTETVVLPDIQELRDGEKTSYANLFGKKLLSKTTMNDSSSAGSTKGRKERPSTKAAPVINIAFYKWDERFNHFENIRDTNTELRKSIDNDSQGARAEMSSRLNQMFAEYRTKGAKEYDKAVRDYKAPPKKKPSKKQGVGKRKE